MSEALRIDFGKPRPAFDQNRSRKGPSRQWTQFGDTAAVPGHRQSLPGLDPVDDLPTVVTQLPY
jgi:hypothetical protein